jgi:PP-loop superfamily ATP-utilizing enzyme
VITQHLASNAKNSAKNVSAFIHDNKEARDLVDNLLRRTQQMVDLKASNVVAFSGGVDSSLVAALVYKTFESYRSNIGELTVEHGSTEINGSVQAVLGISNAVPESQIAMARTVAKTIGIPLREVPTAEGRDDAYIRNDGYACFVCKTHLYSTLESVANAVMKEQDDKQQINGNDGVNSSVILYNGTNADDTQDPTRVGLIAASNFRVLSPLDQITKDQVRQAAKYLGLPNWNAAASPCLRSRLAIGVEATERHLKAVEKAEQFVRRILMLGETRNVRVRMLLGGKAVVELDRLCSDDLDIILREHGFEELCVNEWGFTSFGGVRGFRTGSVAAMPSADKPPKSTMLESRLHV